ncbi:MAG: tetraacyldisaccharide 4'-kinase [Paludibacteraceae bacterium]|nr:tetraacyldisaccharide 4'-kinase [Paludibacteraceae bacterium]
MKFYWYLWPVAWIYGVVVYLRNCFFDWGWIKSQSFKKAVISVGNITVGGTGKTPHVAYLLALLQQQYQVSVVSRGYKRKSRGLQVATPQSNSEQLGDEPYQLYRKYPKTQVVVESNRCKAIQYIEMHYPAVDAVVLDDAFQHRYVEPGMSILLIDYNRLITKDKIMPVGRLRESASGRYRASVIIITKCPANITPIELRNLYNEIEPRAYQRVFYTYYQYAPLYALYTKQSMELSATMATLVVTGVAQPQPIFNYLAPQVASVSTMPFPDHHHFTKHDWENMLKRFEQIESPNKCIVITEKDAARIIDSPLVPEGLKPFIYVLPIKVCFLQDREKEFNQLVLDYVSKNKRNSDFFGR